jgi:rhodanese-related sulfurtransferase
VTGLGGGESSGVTDAQPARAAAPTAPRRGHRAGAADAMMAAMSHPFDAARPHPAGYRELAPEAAHAARDQLRWIDVREAAELIAEGFIAESEHVPLAEVERAAQAWDREDPLVIVCRSGRRSATAAEALVKLGFHQVMNLTGGMIAYAGAQLPIARK